MSYFDDLTHFDNKVELAEYGPEPDRHFDQNNELHSIIRHHRAEYARLECLLFELRAFDGLYFVKMQEWADALLARYDEVFGRWATTIPWQKDGVGRAEMGLSDYRD